MIAYQCARDRDNLSPAGPAVVEEYSKSRYSGREAESSELQKMENSGNEAKKYLKTKDITFFDAAIYARFARKLAAI